MSESGEEIKIDTYDNYREKIEEPMKTSLKSHLGEVVLLSGHGTPGKLLLSLGSGEEISRLECKKGNFFMGSIDKKGKVTLFTSDGKDPVFTGKKQNIFLNR